MSKTYWLGKLRLLAVLAGIVLVVLIARFIVSHVRQTSVYSYAVENDSHHPEMYNEQLEALSGSGTAVLLENDALAFSVDFTDGNIEVLNKNTGYVWRSRPTQTEMASMGTDAYNDLWRASVQSPVLLEYINKLDDSLSTIANAGTQGYTVNVYKRTDGIRVDYQFTTQGIAVALDYYLYNDRLEVDLPNYMIRERPIEYVTVNGKRTPDPAVKSSLVYRVSVLPYFGAGLNDAPGFMMVPDGPGGLIRFSENRNYFTSYAGAVYGNDYSFYSFMDNSLGLQKFYSRIYFPVFGMNRGDNALLAVINYGESNALINAVPAGVRTSFNNVHAQFQYRQRYTKFHNLMGEGTVQYTEASANFSRNIIYYFLEGEDAGYVGMGKAYRSYLTDVKDFDRTQNHAADLPFELSLYGGDQEKQFLLSNFIPMTTFEQAKDIVGYFKDNGINVMNIVYDGWYKGGNSPEFPDRFPPARQLGGEKGMVSFVDYAHSLGYKVYLTDWNGEISSSKGIVKSRDVIFDVQDTPMNWGTYLEPYYLLNPSANARIVNESLKKYQKWGIDGIEEFDADLLVSSQSSTNPVHREQVKNETNAIYRHMADTLGDVRIWRGMAYAIVDGATVVDPAARYSFSPLIDEYVPVYYIAYRGLVDFVTIPINTMDDPGYSMLKAAEYGQNLSFELTHAPTDDLFYAWNSWFLTSTQFDTFQEEFLAIYKKYNEVFADTQGLFITNHENIADNVFRTTFENGKKIVCNYRETDFDYYGTPIPAMGFIVEDTLS